jgi:glycerol-3-phosphate cytidylyltransferase-like family protein
MTDDIVEKYKGKRPIMTYEERTAVVSAICFVDEIIPQDTFEFDKNIEKYHPTIIFDSTQHKRKGSNTFIPYFEEISSSKIKQRIIDANV